MEHKKVDVNVEDKKLTISTDLDQDGKESSRATVFLGEAVQEIFDKGVKKEDVKLVDFELSPMGIKLKLDTDKDGESVFEYELSFGEGVDEALQLIRKKD